MVITAKMQQKESLLPTLCYRGGQVHTPGEAGLLNGSPKAASAEQGIYHKLFPARVFTKV